MIGAQLPLIDADSRLFWEGCSAGKILLQKCAVDGSLRFPPTRYCPHDGSEASAWVEASGRGRVFSWIVVRRPIPKEVFADVVPYIVALITLDEGVRIVSNIIDCKPENVRLDMPVKVTFRAVNDEITLPLFKPL